MPDDVSFTHGMLSRRRESARALYQADHFYNEGGLSFQDNAPVKTLELGIRCVDQALNIYAENGCMVEMAYAAVILCRGYKYYWEQTKDASTLDKMKEKLQLAAEYLTLDEHKGMYTYALSLHAWLDEVAKVGE